MHREGFRCNRGTLQLIVLIGRERFTNNSDCDLGGNIVVRDRCGARLPPKLIPFPRQAAPCDSAVENSRSFLSIKRIYGYRPSHLAYPPSSLPCCAGNSHPVSFLYSWGRDHPVPDRRVSVRNYTKRLCCAGYVVNAYHSAPLGTADPIEGCCRMLSKAA